MIDCVYHFLDPLMEKTDKMEKEILVVKRETLFADNYFQGFLAHNEHDYENLILDHYEYLKRGLAEEDENYQQPIAYCIVSNENNELFAYQRASKKEHAAEERLHGKWSWGIGGHIDKEDTEKSHNPLYTSLLREVEEELGLFDLETITPLGYINDDTNAVGKVHFGILYLVKSKTTTLQLANEIAHGSFVSIDELERICTDENSIVEEWSQLALPAIKSYFSI